MSQEGLALPPDAFEALVEQVPVSIILADREGAIRLWNRASEALFGHSAAEVLGKSLDVIIPEHLRKAHWDGFHGSLATGKTKYGGRVTTTRAAHKDGRKLYVDFSFEIFRDRSGAIVGALAVGRDVTARYAADRSLRAKLAALEQEAAQSAKK